MTRCHRTSNFLRNLLQDSGFWRGLLIVVPLAPSTNISSPQFIFPLAQYLTTIGIFISFPEDLDPDIPQSLSARYHENNSFSQLNQIIALLFNMDNEVNYFLLRVV